MTYEGLKVKEIVHKDVHQAKDIERRQREEGARLKRLLDYKSFTIGQDVEALDAQVAARKARDEQAKKDEYALSNSLNAVDQKLRHMELEKQRAHKKWEESVAEFNSGVVGTSDTKDLNDPHRLRNQAPTRVGDDNIPISSFQKFDGEDLHALRRKQRQQQQMRGIIEQQVVEKSLLKQQEDELERQNAERMDQIHSLRSEVENEEIRLRQKIEQIRHDGNAEACKIKKANETALHGMSSAANELEHHTVANSTLLNEELPKAGRTDGKPDLTNFKGHDKSVWIQCQEDQMSQVLAKQAANAAAKAQDLEVDRVTNMYRTKVTHEMFEAGKRKKLDVTSVQEVNKRMAEEKAARKAALKEENRGESFVSEHFLSRFGSSAR